MHINDLYVRADLDRDLLKVLISLDGALQGCGLNNCSNGRGSWGPVPNCEVSEKPE
jgi:secreted PhoX family phosphatase